MTLAVVTGASRGIGRATAFALAERGCELALIGRPSAEHDQTEHLLRERTTRVEVYHTDVADPDACRSASQHLLERSGVPDVVIHNAASITRSPIVETSNACFDEQLNVNLAAPFRLTRDLLPSMRERRSGRFIFVGSISSTLGTAGAAAYCASKWGLVGFMKSLAEELRDSGLMTVALLPGSVDTRMLQGSGFEPRIDPDQVASTLVHYALDAPLAHNGGVVEMFGV